MLAAAGRPDVDPAPVLAGGGAMDAWRAMIRAQGGDPDAALPVARESQVVTAEADGYVESIDAYGIGIAAWRLGAGRARKEDPVEFGAGVILHRKPGETVRAGDPLYEVRGDDPTRFGAALEAAAQAVRVSQTPPPEVPLLIERVA
jgi:thymidine phosphorylase